MITTIASERDEIIRSLVHDYWANKDNDMVWHREMSSGYYISLGKLLGFLTAFELDMEEDENSIVIKSQKSGRMVLFLRKPHHLAENEG